MVLSCDWSENVYSDETPVGLRYWESWTLMRLVKWDVNGGAFLRRSRR